LGQLQLHEIESSKLHAYQRRRQQDELDAREAAQAHVHRLELDAASAQHEVVRKQAEAVLQAYIKKEEEERRKREEEEKKRLEEEERRRKAEEEERRRRAEEEARKRAEEERRIRKEEEERREREERARQEAERRAKEKADAEERERVERDLAQRKEEANAEKEATVRKQQEEAATKAAPTIQPAIKPATSRPPQVPPSEIEQRHREYLALHKKLKTFRSEFWTSTRKNPALKPHVGDMRRAIRTSVGQLTDDKASNRVGVSHTIPTLMQIVSRLTSITVRPSQDNSASST
jgi:nucleoporin GLE1